MFNGISTFKSYLMPESSLKKNSCSYTFPKGWIICIGKKYLNHVAVCKLFVLRIATWSHNILQKNYRYLKL